jgi:hypothetical protein
MRAELNLVILLFTVAGCATTRVSHHTTELASDWLELPEPLAIKLPFFRTEDELRASYSDPRTGSQIVAIQTESHHNIVILVPLGSGIVTQLIYIYNFDNARKFWVPKAFWITRSKLVDVEFDKISERIAFKSKSGKILLTTTVKALESKVWPDE